MNRWTLVLFGLSALVLYDIYHIVTTRLNQDELRETYLREAELLPRGQSHLHSPYAPPVDAFHTKVLKEELQKMKRPVEEEVPEGGGGGEQPETEEVHKVAGLSCGKHGGPPDELAAEMVYWQDIPTDAKYVSPYKHTGPEPKYLTFEPDEGGWNNIRMSMETAVTLAHATGRTLVMPPEQGMYLLHKVRETESGVVCEHTRISLMFGRPVRFPGR